MLDSTKVKFKDISEDAYKKRHYVLANGNPPILYLAIEAASITVGKRDYCLM